MAVGRAERPGNRREVAVFCGGPGTNRPVAGSSPAPNCPGKEQFSVGERILVVRGGGDVVTRFVGVGPCGARRGQAGGRVVPGAQVAQNLVGDEGAGWLNAAGVGASNEVACLRELRSSS